RGVGVTSLKLVNFTNKRRAERIAYEHFQSIADRANPRTRLLYFPISLTQLSANDSFSVAGGERLFQLVKGVSTEFTMSVDDDRMLGVSAAALVSADRRVGLRGKSDTIGWRVPTAPGTPNTEATVYRLDDAFAAAVLAGQCEVSGGLTEKS